MNTHCEDYVLSVYTNKRGRIVHVRTETYSKLPSELNSTELTITTLLNDTKRQIKTSRYYQTAEHKSYDITNKVVVVVDKWLNTSHAFP